MLGLARKAGIRTAHHRVLNADGDRPVLLVERFDRLAGKRIPFISAMTGNIDDHQRNHGFLREPQGWRLSPAYDINPTTEHFARRNHILQY